MHKATMGWGGVALQHTTVMTTWKSNAKKTLWLLPRCQGEAYPALPICKLWKRRVPVKDIQSNWHPAYWHMCDLTSLQGCLHPHQLHQLSTFVLESDKSIVTSLQVCLTYTIKTDYVGKQEAWLCQEETRAIYHNQWLYIKQGTTWQLFSSNRKPKHFHCLMAGCSTVFRILQTKRQSTRWFLPSYDHVKLLVFLFLICLVLMSYLML